MKSLLVIGGTGFFGKSILDLFIRKGLDEYIIDRVIIMSRNIDDFKKNHSELISEGVEFFEGDILTCQKLPVSDIIIHAATTTSIAKNIDQTDRSCQVIKSDTSNFCNVLSEENINSKIVYCSSGAVYGQQPPNIESMAEDLPFQDISSLPEHKREYAISKRRSEFEIMNLGRTGHNVAIARCFSFFGKYLPKNQNFAYGNFIDDAENGRTINVKAQGLVYRSYMHADDLVHSLIKIALTSSTECPIFNVGSDEVLEIRDLAKSIASQHKVKIELDKISNSQIDRYIPNTGKLNTLLKNG